jgi:hypothetical protein
VDQKEIKMSTLTINYAQAVNAIATCGGTNTILLMGQPGIGKSSILRTLAARMPDYHAAYVDCANLDLGDVAMPVVDRERMVTNYAPSARFGVGTGQDRPVLLLLDELGKAMRPVLNMLLPTLLEKRIGDRELPAGSIVFATTNLASDGVQDVIPPHAHNRMTVLRMSNPTADEWINWAVSNDVAPEVCAFAKQFPQVFDCYVDLKEKEENHYIFNPTRGQVKAFCSPRSLEKASHLIVNRSALGESLIPLLSGTVGEAAARDMEALVHLADQVPTMEEIVKSPTKVALPKGVTGYFLLAFMLAGRVKPENIDPIVTYLNRWDNFEATSLAVIQMVNRHSETKHLVQNTSFMKLAAQYAAHL